MSTPNSPKLPQHSNPKSDKPQDNPSPRTDGKSGVYALNFEDHAEFPAAQELNAKANPFQDKVNELAKTGKSASVRVEIDDEKWARDQIRRAANNIEKGARTRTVAEKHPTTGKEMVRVYFEVREMQKRPRNGK